LKKKPRKSPRASPKYSPRGELTEVQRTSGGGQPRFPFRGPKTSCFVWEAEASRADKFPEGTTRLKTLNWFKSKRSCGKRFVKELKSKFVFFHPLSQLYHNIGQLSTLLRQPTSPRLRGSRGFEG